jgi:hypothetical protein
MFDPIHAPSKDAPKNPTVQIDDNVVHLTRHDPYGHIYLSLENGELPAKYQGAYTTMTEAHLAVARYIDERNKASEELTANNSLPTANNSLPKK